MGHVTRIAILCAALLVLPREARSETRTFSTRYFAHDGCPDITTFESELARRGSHLMPIGDRTSDVRVGIAIDRTRDGSVGRLEIDSGDGLGGAREVEGATCAEVVSALALVASLMLDGDRTRPARSQNETATPTIASSTQQVIAAAPASALAAPAPPPHDTTIAPTAHAEVARGLWSVGLHVVVDGAVPAAGTGGAAFVELHERRLGGAAARASFLYAPTIDVAANGGAARFGWFAGRLEACPMELAAFAHIAIAPCGAIEAGRVQATGLRAGIITNPSSDLVPWIAGRLLARLRSELGALVFAEVEGGIALPFRGQDYVFQNPSVTVARTPTLGPFVELGIGVAIP